MEIIHDMEQGTPEWLNLRLGLITCSKIDVIRADGVGAQDYANALAYERITGESSSVFNGNQWTERGHELEPIARELYQEKTGLIVEEVAFIKNKGFGYSPDGLIYGFNLSTDFAIGAIEIKAKQPAEQIKILRSNEIPKKHLDQLHGGLLCAELEWIDFVSYCPNLPIFIKRLWRKDCIEQLDKLNILIDKYNQLVETVTNEVSEMY